MFKSVSKILKKVKEVLEYCMINQQKINLIILLFCFLPMILAADVIYEKSAYADFGLIGSLELTSNYEYAYSAFKTANIWGGFGVVSGLYEASNKSVGFELALESRQYFKADKYKAFNFGLYLGLAFMNHLNLSNEVVSDDNSVGVVPGVKITYKKRLNQLFVLEPYFGISNPFHNDINKESNFENLGFKLTIGIRFGLNKLKIKPEPVSE